MIGGGPQKITVEIGGKIAASLGASIRTAQVQVSSFGRNVTRTMNDAATAGRKGFKGMFDNALWQQAAVGATAYAGALGMAVREAVKLDKAMADVRKAIDFKDGEKGLKRFGHELVKLSTQMPYSAEELSKIAAAAGFAGYKENEIIPFTKAAARMGVAFQMTAADAGDAMVAMRAAMGLTQPEVEKLGDAINYLSDKFEGTVNAADLTEVTRRIGAIGKAAGLTSEQVAGMSAAFLASGTPTEVAATGLKNFLNALTKGEQASANQNYALATLFGPEGLANTLKTGKAKYKRAAKGVAVDISQELAKGMQIDPEGTIKSVLQRMAQLPKEQQVSIAGALFGEESKQAIMPLLTNLKLVEQAFDLIRDKQAFTGSMQKEFGNQMQTTDAQFKIFQNGISAVGISIGAVLLPSINKILKTVTPVLISFAEWAQKNEGIVTTVVSIGAAIAGLVLVTPIISGIGAAFGVVVGIIGAVAGAAPLLAGIGTVFALVVPPIGIAAAAIAGVAALAYVVIRNWRPISGFFIRLWSQIRKVWDKFPDMIGNAFSAALDAIKSWPKRMLDMMFPLPAMIVRIFSAANIGQKIVKSIFDGIRSAPGKFRDWLGDKINDARQFIFDGNDGQATQPSPRAPEAPPVPSPPGRARGGPVRAGMPYLVGERRPELFVPGMDGGIIPRVAAPVTAAALAAVLAGPAPAAAAPAITINAPVTINAAGGDHGDIRRQVEDAFVDILRRVESSHRMLLND